MSTDQAPPSKPINTQPKKEPKNDQPTTEGAEEEPYEPWNHREIPHPLGVIGAFLHLLKGSLGTGILSMPMAFRNGGLWAGLAGSIAVGILYTHCAHITVKSSQVLCARLRQPHLTYGELAEVSFKSGHEKIQRFSRAFRNILEGALFLDYFLGCAIYILFPASTIKQVLELHWTDSEGEAMNLDLRWYIMICTLAMLPLGLITNLKYLVPFSFVAIFTLSFGVAYVFSDLFQGLPSISERPVFTNIFTYTMMLSTVVYAMNGMGTLMPIENDMRDPRRMLGCPGILHMAMACLIFVYTSLGFIGFWRYGNDTKGIITLNIQASVPGLFVKCMVTINVAVSYALFFFVVCGVVWRRIQCLVGEKSYYYMYFGMRVVLTLLAGFIAALVPDIEIVIGIVGSVCAATIILFCPPMIELATFWEDCAYMGPFRWKLYKNIMIVIFYLLCLMSGVGQTIKKIIAIYSGEDKHKEVYTHMGF